MLYQRARTLDEIVDLRTNAILKPLGTLLWVKVGPPIAKKRRAIYSNRQALTLGYETNILKPKDEQRIPGPMIAVRADRVELLPEFTDDPPLIDFETWWTQEGE